MAKGNVFMGTLKGRVGDTVFYVKQGEQNAIKYQRNISNPQSAPQMYQRSRFLAANKFYTRGRQAFFKFAYENKRKGESDFNAFMRENIGEAPNITRDAFNYYNYPIVGHFKVSNGSLPTILCREGSNGWQANLGISYPSTSISTVGELSALMIANDRYQVGDIITLLFIDAHTSIGVPSLKPSQLSYAYGTPEWKIIQFKVNTLDVTHLTDLGLWYARDTTGELVLIGDEDTDFLPSSSICAFTCVHSRQTRSRLKVSTQQLYINNLAQQADDAQREDEYIAEVIADWRTTAEVPVTSEVILKGALTTSDTNVSGITLVSRSDSPFELTNATFNANYGIEDNEMYSVGYISGSNISEGMFSAVLVEGDEDSVIQFDQVDKNTVAISLEAHGSTGQQGNFRILMRANGQDIPIAEVSFIVRAHGQDPLDDIKQFDLVASEINGIEDGDTPPKSAVVSLESSAQEQSLDLLWLIPADDKELSLSDFTANNVEGSVILQFIADHSGNVAIRFIIPANFTGNVQRTAKYQNETVAVFNITVS